ncbi:uncharacterized protein LOC119437661 [Dermacentor silvarum]|uniref:uncharacterized protein LOC119437661 n=1 Tax=Dermacentor silvarum TaxID=543639 RepID=UPI00189856E0|nr:uncharacterized protein LOC119437661 [Dermacentor silvarum]
MITSIVRLAVDPWSRRQHPIRVPKGSWFNRHPKFTVIAFSVGGTCILFSRVIYDLFTSFAETEPSAKQHKLDLVMLLQQTCWRKEGERPRSLEEALIEQDMIREQQRKEKEQQAALAVKL